MKTCVPAVAFSRGGRLLALGLALVAGGVARAETPAPTGDVATLVAKAKKAATGKRWREAKRAAMAALAVAAANVEAKAWLGLADKGLGDCKGALAPLDEAFAAKTDVPGVAGALAACLGDKAADKQKLAEARLAAAREAAAAGHAAEAHALYESALGAALLTQPVEREAPEDTTEGTGAPAPIAEAPATSAPAPAAEPPEADTAAAEARAQADAAAEAARAEAARRREQQQAPPSRPVAPGVLVAAPAPPPAPRPPLAFQVGIRSAVSAKDSAGAHHSEDAGLVLTWLTLAAPYSRVAIVVDLESTRWRAAREDLMNRGATAFYGLGADWSVPLMLGNVGLVAGAEAMAGLLQSATDTSSVNDGVVVELMPHAGAVALLPRVGVGLFADAGWRFQPFEPTSLGKASESGFVFQGGLRLEMREAEPAPRGYAVGYEARFFAPNGSNIYARYGGLPLTNSKGPLLGHEVTVTTGEYLPRGAEHGLALTYMGSDRSSGPSLQTLGVGYLATYHAFATRQLFNPFLGAQVGVVYIKTDDALTFSRSSTIGAVGTLRAGLDVDVARRVALRAGFAYDAVWYSNDVPGGSLSGYAVEAGAIIRL